MEACTPVCVESTLGYHPSDAGILTIVGKPVIGQYQADSLTGAVASKRVTEAPKGFLSADRNRAKECKGRRELDCETNKSSKDESRA